jgi:hypothetical protein
VSDQRWRPIPRAASEVVCTFAADAHDQQRPLRYISADAAMLCMCSHDSHSLSPDPRDGQHEHD